MDYSIYQLLALFLIYSFLGWCVEVSFVAITLRQVVNRGFLNGPVCPIYGVGMVGVLLLLEPISKNLLLLFVLGMLLCTVVELVGGWILEKVFHTRWWDYTDQPLNLGGYVCLGFSLMWGAAVTVVVRLIHPLLFSFVRIIPHPLGIALLILFYGVFLADLTMTLITIIGMRKRLGELERLAQTLHTIGDALSDRLGTSALAADAKLDEVKQSGQERLLAGKELLSEGKERLSEGVERMETALESSQQKWETAMESGQQKWEAAKESGQQKWDAAKESGQQKWDAGKDRLGELLTASVQELLERKQQLEQRQKALSEEFTRHPKFGVKRISKAFPAVRQAIRNHLDHMDQE